MENSNIHFRDVTQESKTDSAHFQLRQNIGNRTENLILGFGWAQCEMDL